MNAPIFLTELSGKHVSLPHYLSPLLLLKHHYSLKKRSELISKCNRCNRPSKYSERRDVVGNNSPLESCNCDSDVKKNIMWYANSYLF